MTTLSATQNGNINNPSTWGGFIPTSTDILDSNGYKVVVNVDSVYDSLINTNGGYFELLDGVSLSANITNTQVDDISGYCVLYEGNSSASITGKIKGGGLPARHGVFIDNNNHLIVNGDVVGGFKLTTTGGGGMGINSSVNAGGSLIINGNVGVEGTFNGPSSQRSQFAAINSEALSSIKINGDITIPSSSDVEGLKALIVKTLPTTLSNPIVEINGNIGAFDNHGYGTGVASWINAVQYSGNSSISVSPGLFKVNGNIETGASSYYTAAYIAGNCNIIINGDLIVGGNNTSRGLYITNNNNSSITLSATSGTFTGTPLGHDSNPALYLLASSGLTVNIIGNINCHFLRVGSNDSAANGVTNSIINIEGDIRFLTGGQYSVILHDYFTNSTLNVVGNIYGGSNSAIYIQHDNSTANFSLNVFANEIHGGISGHAIYTNSYDQNMFFDINATEIAAHPGGGTGHAIQAVGRYLGTFKINAKRILDNFAGTTALWVRAYDLSDVPTDAVIRYAAAPFAGVGPYVIHSTINSLSTFQMPPPDAVREGVVYAGGSLIGSCRIPSVSSVLLGTPVGAPDGNVGIATLDKTVLNYDALYNAPLTAFDRPDTAGRKLRLCPSTEVVGEIIESFQIAH